MAGADERGVSDILSIALMALLTIFAGVLLHAVQSDILDSAVRRQLQLRAQHTYHMLANAMVENSGKSYLRTLAEDLRDNSVENDFLAVLSSVLERVRSDNLTVEFRMRAENSEWLSLKVPADPGRSGDRFSFSAWYTLISASENPEEGVHLERFEVEISLVRAG